MLAVALLLPSSAVAQGGRLTAAAGAPLASTFKPAKKKFRAELALTVRNDSSYSGPLRVKLVYDDGTAVRLRRKRRTMAIAGQTLKLWLKRRGNGRLLIGPRNARRLKLQAWVKPLPKSPLGGTLVVSGRRKSSVSPLTVPVKLSPPATKPAAASIWHGADVEPSTVVINVYRVLPSPIAPTWLLVDRQDVQVKGIGAGEDVEAGRLTIEPVSGDTGGRGSVEIWAPWGLQPAKHRATIRADVRRITTHGTYEATIPLAEGDDKSATITIKTQAADLFIWPLLALFAGAALAYRLLRDEEEARPKEVLRLALTDLKAAHAKDHEDDKTSPVPYDFDDVFPSDTTSWDDCTLNDKTEAHELYCRIGAAKLVESLDDIQEEIADLDARVTGWPVSRAKVVQLEAARKSLAPTTSNAAASSTACAATCTCSVRWT